MAATESQHGHRATHPRLHIRNAHEAHTLFEAVRLGLLPIVRRRLSPTDRELQSGEVFVWEEASYKGGLERWTDGRKWSQSRMREPFLFYEEKAMPSREEKDAKAARRARKSSDPASPTSVSAVLPSSPSPPRRQDRPTKPKGLTKQTYSAFVHTPNSPANQAPKKWHLTAYFCSTTYHELPVCADDSVLRSVTVPEGVYVTGKGLTRKNGSQRGVERKETPSSSTPAPSSLPPQAPMQQLPQHPPQGYYPPHYPHPHDAAPSYPPHPHAYPPHPQYAPHRPPPPPSETPSAPADDGASNLDSGSRSPWSSSSSAMPVTPPPQSYPAYGPSSGYPPPPNAYGPPPPHHAGGYAPPYYAAPQPHYAPPGQPHSYVYETAVPAVKGQEPVVYDATPRPASTLPPLPPRYEEPPMKTPLPPALAATTLPPPAPVSAPQSYPGPTPSSSSPSSVLPNPSYPPPPPHTPFQSHFSATPGSAGSQYSPGHAQPVGYSTSDVRGEAPPSPTGSARSAGSATAGPRYSARHSLDQRALGAFKVTL
ncbi:hypothetical protein M407DRAFT_244750 [Tulasnella calospora MUT 4182]|uniref:cAMP-independent regulatory protein pac2 n=1 Tax=Tulasnella calospora MUT 4182 TaxID=1051891 RepID=A0A0C3Q3W1_9AGAM|nr:hypothetical protein M407DRAFT_244750 [Tulasnella calospora MUT 4182]